MHQENYFQQSRQKVMAHLLPSVFTMNPIVQKQEEIIAQLQLAVEHYLEEGNLEAAHSYSELFKINCEAYKALTATPEVKEEKPAFRFGKPGQLQRLNNLPDEQVAAINKERERQQTQMNYENQMRSQYTQIAQRDNQPPQPVISQYSYGDGQDNPKIRAGELGSDISRRSWNINQEPNQVITPPQQLIPSVQDNSQEDIWEEDPRRNFNR